MKRRRTLIVIVGLAAIFLLACMALKSCNNLRYKAVDSSKPQLHLNSAEPAPQVSPNKNVPPVNVSQTAHDVNAQMAVDRLYKTPIYFYGKVVDESGKPIEDAKIKIMVADVELSPGKRYDLISNAAGLFSLTDAHGAAITVDVTKEGYNPTSRSSGMFRLGDLQSNSDPNLPSPADPAVFVLQSIGKTDSLIKARAFIHVPRNGQPVYIDLTTGKAVSGSQGNVRVETFIDDESKNAQGRYSWRCEVSVPGGGLVERIDQFVFEAPADGYQNTDEIDMPQNADNWKPMVQRQYFLQLGDGRYARVQFEVVAQGVHFFSIQSYLNPVSGSRNLSSGSVTGN